MVLSPRQRFQENQPHKIRHQEVVVSESFRAAAEAALVEQVMTLPTTYDPHEAQAAYYRLVGARDFLHHLLNIAEKPSIVTVPMPQNLDHHA